MPSLSLSKLASALLRPRKVALIGASDDPTKTASRPLQYLRRSGFSGVVYPVNPTRESVLGERAWASLDALPERPDHAFILTSADAAVASVEECGRLGVPVATVLASGFAEAGGAGAAREARLRAVISETGIRVVGPSSLGVVSVQERLTLTANAAFAEPGLSPGGIFVASHSGSLIGGLVSRGMARGVGFAGLVSVGNETDLSIGEICEATLDDPSIESYVLFLEGIRHADALRRFAIGASERGKSVLAYKLGRTTEASELALTHTGALAGEDDVAGAFLAACGIARVETFDALLDAPPLVAKVAHKCGGATRPKVGVLATTGGGAAMAVDQLALRGIDVPGPSEDTLALLRERCGIEIKKGRVVDLTLAGTRYDVMKAALDTMLNASEFDLVLVVVGSSARFHPELAVRAVCDSAGSRLPLSAFIVPEAPDALALLTSAGVPNFRSPETCADAIAAALNRRAVALPLASPSGAIRPTETVDELRAYEVLAALGISHAPAIALPVDASPPCNLPFSYPVAVKLLSSDVLHKSDIGGVVLGVKGDEELAEAIGRIVADVASRNPDTIVQRVLVQPMQAGIGEVLLGYRHDPQVGPIVLLAPGGVLAEIYRDRAVRLAPVDHAEALAMIDDVRGLAALKGYRGKPAGDLQALAEAIVNLSKLALNADVSEAEINPLMVTPDGVVAVDAVVRLGNPANSQAERRP